MPKIPGLIQGDDVILKVLVKQGPNGAQVLFANARQIPDAVLQLLDLEGLNENATNKYIFTQVSIPLEKMQAAYKSDSRTKALGNLLEALVVKEWIEQMTVKGIAAEKTDEALLKAMSVIAESSAVLKVSSTKKGKEIYEQTEEGAKRGVTQIFPAYEQEMRAAGGKVSIKHQGGSSGIGDVILNIAGVRIVIECKNYSLHTFSSFEDNFKYFQLSDEDKKNFGMTFRDYLAETKKIHGHRVWRERGHGNFAPPDEWKENVLNFGFEGFWEELGAKNKDLFLYLLQKGSQYSKDVQKRPFIGVVRGEYGHGLAALYVEADLLQLESIEDATRRIYKYDSAKKQSILVFQNAKDEEIGKLNITDKSAEEIKEKGENAAYATSAKKKDRWSTTFNFIINRTLLNDIQ